MGNHDDDVVKVGSSVRIRDGELEEEWRIVAGHEADAERGYMSENSPLALALLGHHAGEHIRVQSPAGRRVVAILGVIDLEVAGTRSV